MPLSTNFYLNLFADDTMLYSTSISMKRAKLKTLPKRLKIKHIKFGKKIKNL